MTTTKLVPKTSKVNMTNEVDNSGNDDTVTGSSLLLSGPLHSSLLKHVLNYYPNQSDSGGRSNKNNKEITNAR